jgi:hypothetical protein
MDYLRTACYGRRAFVWISYNPLCWNNVLLIPSDATVKTQGDLKASLAALQFPLDRRIRGDRSNSELRRKEIDDLKARTRAAFPRRAGRARESYV